MTIHNHKFYARDAHDGAHALADVALQHKEDLTSGDLANRSTFEILVSIRAIRENKDGSVEDSGKEGVVQPLLEAGWKERAYNALAEAIAMFEAETKRRPTQLLLHPEVLAFIQTAFTVVDGVPLYGRAREMFRPDAVVVNQAADEQLSERMAVYRVEPLRELAKVLWP